MNDAMSFPVGSVLPEVVLLAGSIVVLLAVLFAPERHQRLAAPLTLAVLAVAAGASAPMLGGSQGTTFTDTYATDDVAVWSKLIVIAATALVVGLSVSWFRPDPRRGEYFTLLLMAALGAVIMAGAADTMELLLGVLLSSVTGYFLAAYHRRAAHSVEAGIKYYLLGALTNGAFLYGVVLLFGVAGTTTLRGQRAGLADGDGVAVVAATALVLLGLAFKIGSVPAHAWVPDVAQGAPAPAAAFLTAVPKIGAFVGLARLAATLPETVGWRPAVAILAAATMTLGNLAALWQDDVRRLLGWSAVSQTGYALLALVALGRSELAVPALLYFLFAYAMANIAAFGVVVGLRGRTALADYDGLARGHPLVAAALVVSFLSFVGIPPLAGFVGKLTLFVAAIEAGYGWLAALAAANTVVSVFYYVRVIAPAYFGPADSAAPVLGPGPLAVVGVAVAAVVVVGVVAEPLLDALSSARLLPR